MAKLLIDGKEVEVPAEYTLLQACEAAGAEIPRFCYHERLSIAGNCRMCLVEVKGSPKPVASCAWGVRDCRPGPNGEPPEVFTRSAMVKKAREGVMEFLLINHPLDCPICDQGGECDLQDQAMGYGIDAGRYKENKRAVEDKYMGAVIKTSMSRCIQCTRCVRFTTEICGVSELGAIGRGEDMEITTYLEGALTSELQGNLADICPVGALTSKPYAFSARPWELTKTESVDVMDAVGSAIRVDTRGREVMRVLPRVHEAINEEWISDKTRLVADGLRVQRLDRPYVREGGKLRAASWTEAFAAIAAKVKPLDGKRIGAIAGDLASCEEMFALKELMGKLGSANLDCRQDGALTDPKAGRATYIFNPAIAGIEEADALLIVGCNPRKEAALINARIRKRWRTGALKVGVIGEKADLTYAYDYLGAGPDTLADVASGKSTFAAVLKDAKKPIVLVGAGVLARHDGAAVASLAAKVATDCGALAEGWNGFGVVQNAAARVGGLDLGIVPGAGGLTTAQMATFGTLDVLFLLGADEVKIADGTFVVYIGSHGDQGAHRADVILPGAAYTEKSGTYVNTEGRAQLANRAAFPPGTAREDWAVLCAVAEALGKPLAHGDLASLRQAMVTAAPQLGARDAVAPGSADDVRKLASAGGTPEKSAFVSPVADFYLTNPIARASATLAECSALATGRRLTAAE